MFLLFKIVLVFRFKCKRCKNNLQIQLPPENSDCTSDLSQWYHCSNNRGLPDSVISKAWEVGENVSFIFHHRSNSAVVEAKIAEDAATKKRLQDIEDAENAEVNGKKKKMTYEYVEEDVDYESEVSVKDDNSDDDFML